MRVTDASRSGIPAGGPALLWSCAIVLTVFLALGTAQGCRTVSKVSVPAVPTQEDVAAVSSAMTAKSRPDYVALEEAIRQGGPPLAPVIAEYLDFPNPNVRLAAARGLAKIGEMYNVRSEPFIVKPLLKALTGDWSVAGAAAGSLIRTDPRAFSDEDRRYLVGLLNTKPCEQACLVVGAVNMPEARESLVELTKSDNKELAWAAKKALARMGVGTYAEEIARDFRESPDKTLKTGKLLNNLIYVNQPPCILAVGDMLNSTEMEPSLGYDHLARPMASCAAEAMNQMKVHGFPVNKPWGLRYNPQELDQCRKWWAENRHRFVTPAVQNKPDK